MAPEIEDKPYAYAMFKASMFVLSITVKKKTKKITDTNLASEDIIIFLLRINFKE